MNDYWYWSWILTAIGVTGIWLTGSKKWYGFAVGVLAQVLWVAYAVTTRQWGFLASAAAYGFVYARGWWKWTRPAGPATRSASDTLTPCADADGTDRRGTSSPSGS